MRISSARPFAASVSSFCPGKGCGLWHDAAQAVASGGIRPFCSPLASPVTSRHLCQALERHARHDKRRTSDAAFARPRRGCGNRHLRLGLARRVILPSTIGNNPIFVSPVASSTVRTCRSASRGAPRAMHASPPFRENRTGSPRNRRPPLRPAAAPRAQAGAGSRKSGAGSPGKGPPENPAGRRPCPVSGAGRGRRQVRVRKPRTSRRTFEFPHHPEGRARVRQSVSRHSRFQTPFLLPVRHVASPSPRAPRRERQASGGRTSATHPTGNRSGRHSASRQRAGPALHTLRCAGDPDGCPDAGTATETIWSSSTHAIAAGTAVTGPEGGGTDSRAHDEVTSRRRKSGAKRASALSAAPGRQQVRSWHDRSFRSLHPASGM